MAVKHYELRRKFWNGKVQFPVGHIEPFEEGNQPSSAVEVAEPELVVEAPKKAALPDTPNKDK
jgi:hypothetical protein